MKAARDRAFKLMLLRHGEAMLHDMNERLGRASMGREAREVDEDRD